MELIRGTTPTIEINILTEIDLHQVSEVWVYISQQNKVKVDKKIDDVTFDHEHRKIFVTLSQQDTLDLKAGTALFQMRLLLQNGTALANIALEIEIDEIYKPGIIGEDTNTEG